MKSVINIFFTLSIGDISYQFMHSFAANIVESKEGAISLAPFICNLVEDAFLIEQSDPAISLSTIKKIVKHPETKPIIQNKKNLESLGKLKNLSSKGYASYVFTIISLIIEIPGAKEIICDESFLNIVNSTIDKLPDEHKLKQKLLNIQKIVSN
jgi:hypothetical protein